VTGVLNEKAEAMRRRALALSDCFDKKQLANVLAQAFARTVAPSTRRLKKGNWRIQKIREFRRK
jgi:hypothetical protein